MKTISEYKQVDGEMKLVTREMTAEEEAEIGKMQVDEPKQETDALKEMITEMSKATTLAQMRSAAGAFLEKTE